MEMLLANQDIDINYCISWANHNWETTWIASPGSETTLIAHNFDIEEDFTTEEAVDGDDADTLECEA